MEEMANIGNKDRLIAYPFYFAALGEFELRVGRQAVARDSFRAAAALARSQMERNFFQQRMAACGSEEMSE
ncbi:MAG: hypothetical protein ABR991_13860 [Terracidiphilus sp.]